mmetsp:Transcript_1961/g.5235  ORF Transcript_1961/g.5235 Transcript_1961/m.5235 type:complete len:138 (-) Transcript_1961:286-699(-)
MLDTKTRERDVKIEALMKSLKDEESCARARVMKVADLRNQLKKQKTMSKDWKFNATFYKNLWKTETGKRKQDTKIEALSKSLKAKESYAHARDVEVADLRKQVKKEIKMRRCWKVSATFFQNLWDTKGRERDVGLRL